MQVYSINSSNLRLNQSFGNRDLQEKFAELSDGEIRTLAYNKASHDVSDKKHRRLNNAIMYSIPVAAGIAAAAATKTNRIGKLAAFGLGAASWAVPFAIVDATFGAKHFLDKRFKSLKDFSNDHPFASLMGAVGASFVAFALARKGGAKVIEKYGDKIEKTAKPYIKKLAKALDNSKVLNKAQDLFKKVPSSFKAFSQTALNWAPWALFFTAIAHTASHDKAKNVQYAQNYQELKKAQTMIREDLCNAKAEALKEQAIADAINENL